MHIFSVRSTFATSIYSVSDISTKLIYIRTIINLRIKDEHLLLFAQLKRVQPELHKNLSDTKIIASIKICILIIIFFEHRVRINTHVFKVQDVLLSFCFLCRGLINLNRKNTFFILSELKEFLSCYITYAHAHLTHVYVDGLYVTFSLRGKGNKCDLYI